MCEGTLFALIRYVYTSYSFFQLMEKKNEKNFGTYIRFCCVVRIDFCQLRTHPSSPVLVGRRIPRLCCYLGNRIFFSEAHRKGEYRVKTTTVRVQSIGLEPPFREHVCIKMISVYYRILFFKYYTRIFLPGFLLGMTRRRI